MSDFPTVTKQGAAIIHGNHTDVVCTKYSNLIFVIVTQHEKIGCLLQVTPDTPLPEENQTVTVRFVLGHSDEIAERIMKEAGTPIPVLVGVSLKDYSPEHVRAAIDLVMSKRVW